MSKKLYIIIITTWVVMSLALSFWNPNFLVLLFVPPMVSPVFKSSGIIEGVDEREKLLEFKSSQLALLTTYAVILFIFILSLFIKKKNPEPEWYLVLIVPIAVRWAALLAKTRGVRKLGLALGLVFGSLWTLFALLSHGLSLEGMMESLVGLSILLPTLVALKWPKVGGPLLVLTGLVLFLIFIKTGSVARPISTQIIMSLILPLPPFLGGLLVFIPAINGKTDEFIEYRGD